jgi:hypothetical protein
MRVLYTESIASMQLSHGRSGGGGGVVMENVVEDSVTYAVVELDVVTPVVLLDDEKNVVVLEAILLVLPDVVVGYGVVLPSEPGASYLVVVVEVACGVYVVDVIDDVGGGYVVVVPVSGGLMVDVDGDGGGVLIGVVVGLNVVLSHGSSAHLSPQMFSSSSIRSCGSPSIR